MVFSRKEYRTKYVKNKRGTGKTSYSWSMGQMLLAKLTNGQEETDYFTVEDIEREMVALGFKSKVEKNILASARSYNNRQTLESHPDRIGQIELGWIEDERVISFSR